MLVVGDREAESATVAVRRHKEGDVGTLSVEEFAQRIADEVAEERSSGVPAPAGAE
jgi:threonyl-tRNA synthetase